MKNPKVNIRPQVTVLSVLKYLEYETWFALAEFVDNSIASYCLNEKRIKIIDGDDFRLQITIEINEPENKIIIRDNAAGICEEDYPRAFRAAEIPLDNTGLSEFGMGMKSAACWFADKWRVSTKALGEQFEKRVTFDMNKIFKDKIEELDVETKKCNKDFHYTVIELINVNRMPRGRGIGKVKEHLKSIYRDFLRNNVVKIVVAGEALSFSEQKILVAPKWDNPKGESVIWKKEIAFNLGKGKYVHGFAAIREKASTSEAGFALFRRGRVIEGSFDNGYRPEFIFGNPNSFRFQRVFGEIHLDGFDANFTKKGIHWNNELDGFLRELKNELSSKDFPLLQQAENYRVRATEKEYKTAKKVLYDTVDDLKKKLPSVVEQILSTAPKVAEPIEKGLTESEKVLQREFKVNFNRINWNISIELSYDQSIKDLIEIGDSFIKNKVEKENVRHIGIRLSLIHPFMVEHVGVDSEKIESVLRIVAALGLSEVIAKSSGVKTQGEVRRNFNEVILKISKQE